MSTIKSPLIASLVYEIQQCYSQKSLTEKSQSELNKTINEMHMLSIIYQQCSQQNKEIIDRELLNFQKKLKEESKKVGGFFKWMGWGEIQVINLDGCWEEVGRIRQAQCQRLIDDIVVMKKGQTLLL